MRLHSLTKKSLLLTSVCALGLGLSFSVWAKTEPAGKLPSATVPEATFHQLRGPERATFNQIGQAETIILSAQAVTFNSIKPANHTLAAGSAGTTFTNGASAINPNVSSNSTTLHMQPANDGSCTACPDPNGHDNGTCAARCPEPINSPMPLNPTTGGSCMPCGSQPGAGMAPGHYMCPMYCVAP